MTDDISFTELVIGLLIALGGFSIAHLVLDFRHFKEIANQCDKQGYIQNETTRIQCRVEKP